MLVASLIQYDCVKQIKFDFKQSKESFFVPLMTKCPFYLQWCLSLVSGTRLLQVTMMQSRSCLVRGHSYQHRTQQPSLTSTHHLPPSYHTSLILYSSLNHRQNADVLVFECCVDGHRIECSSIPTFPTEWWSAAAAGGQLWSPSPRAHTGGEETRDP